MARGNCIIVTSDPKGQFEEGYVATAEKPGTLVQRDPTVALKGGKHTYKVYQPGADGRLPVGSYWVLRENWAVGKTVNDAYDAGGRCLLYSPRAGEELNLLLADVAGTADTHPAGEKLMAQNNTGKLIVAAGTEGSNCAQLLETVTAPTGDTLAWCQWTGQ